MRNMPAAERAANTTVDPMLGQLALGRYRVIKPMATGGMGVVYLGRTEGAAGFSRPVVIKRVLPQLITDPNIAKMFIREARILSNLNHTGIVGVVDFGQEDDAYVMVLDYVHGYDAGAWLLYHRKTKQPIPQDIAIQIAIRVLEALQYAHTLKRADGTSLQVVHRDISPGNILLDVEGHVRLLDFGIARIADEANEYRTQETTFKGKLGYAHPSLLSRGEPSPQTDVYSTAVVLFQLLTGTNPFRGSSTTDTLSRIVNLPLPRLSEYLPGVDPGLENVLLKAMSRDLAFGYQSAADMADALRKVRNEDESALTGQMAELFSQDFLGDMPSVLELQPLDERDSAWRMSLDDPPSRPPLMSTPPRTNSVSESPTDAGSEGANRSTDTSSDVTVFAPVPATRTSKGQGVMALAIGGLAIALVALAAVMLYKPPSTSPEARYVVVSKESTTNRSGSEAPTGEGSVTASAATSAGAQPLPSSAVTPAEDLGQPPVGLPSAPSRTGPKVAATVGGAQEPTGQLLTQRFAKHQGRVQACFTQNPELAHTVSSVQISFKVNAAGAVQQTGLIPSSLAGNPLGQCLLRVAQSASFGALTDSASFRIPVQARVK